MTLDSRALRPIPLALSLATFLAISYLACLALSLVVPDRALHEPWLQFFVGFTWTPLGILLGLVESLAYGFFSGLVFAPIFNLFNARR
jgi:hypothetical protein